MLTTEQVKQVLVSVPVDKNTDVVIRNKVLMTRPMTAPGKPVHPLDVDVDAGWTHHGHVHDMEAAVGAINEHFAAIGDPRADKMRLGFRRVGGTPDIPHGQPGHVCGHREVGFAPGTNSTASSTASSTGGAGGTEKPKFYGIRHSHMHRAAELTEAIKQHLMTGSPLPDGVDEVDPSQIPMDAREQLRAQGIPLEPSPTVSSITESGLLSGPITEQLIRDTANHLLQSPVMDTLPPEVLGGPPDLLAAMKESSEAVGIPQGLMAVLTLAIEEDQCNCGDCVAGRLYGYTWAKPYEELRFKAIKLIVDARGPQVGTPCWKGKPMPKVCADCGRVHGEAASQSERKDDSQPVHPWRVVKGPQGVQ